QTVPSSFAGYLQMDEKIGSSGRTRIRLRTYIQQDAEQRMALKDIEGSRKPLNGSQMDRKYRQVLASRFFTNNRKLLGCPTTPRKNSQ
ncbi:MAG TPA: hypothetical protein VMH03_08990, partial [Terriglobales bacterium]|nr:hypothetical protein [Terriglobales bacterium]